MNSISSSSGAAPGSAHPPAYPWCPQRRAHATESQTARAHRWSRHHQRRIALQKTTGQTPDECPGWSPSAVQSSASAMRRMESVNTPVALTTMRAGDRQLLAGLLVARRSRHSRSRRHRAAIRLQGNNSPASRRGRQPSWPDESAAARRQTGRRSRPRRRAVLRAQVPAVAPASPLWMRSLEAPKPYLPASRS